jgi:hypothetical protein
MKGREDSDKAQMAKGRIQWHMFVNAVCNFRLHKNMEFARFIVILSWYRSLWFPCCLYQWSLRAKMPYVFCFPQSRYEFLAGWVFHDAVSIETYNVGWYNDWWIGRDFEGSGPDLIEISQHLPGWTLRKTSVGIASVPAEIRSQYFRNTSLEHFRYTNLFGHASQFTINCKLPHYVMSPVLIPTSHFS